MSSLVSPHGGMGLRPLLLSGAELQRERQRAQSLPQVRVSSRERGDIIMLGIGGFTPLDGFMTHADWRGVCDGMQNGRAACSGRSRSRCRPTAPTAADVRAPGTTSRCVDPDDGTPLATMKVTEKYAIDKAHECATVFSTTDPEHPGVKHGDGARPRSTWPARSRCCRRAASPRSTATCS